HHLLPPSFPTRRSSDLFWHELLDSREDDAARSDLEQFAQVTAIFGLYRGLSKEITSRLEHAEQLIVKVIPIGQHNDGRIPHDGIDRKSTRLNSSHEWIS